MQEPLSAYSESHQKLVRALSALAGNQQSYSRQELVRLVRRKYPELNKNDIKPQKHCLNYEATSACECSQTAQALFEKLETPDGSTRYRVLATESNTGPLSRPAHSKPQNASAFARAPVMATRRPEPVVEEEPKDVLKKILEQAPETPSALSKPHPAEAPKGLRAWQKLGLEISQQIAQGLKQRLFGPKESLESIEQDLKQNFKITLPKDLNQSAGQPVVQSANKLAEKSRFSLPPLPALPALPTTASQEPPQKSENKPKRAILQVLRLPAPDGIQRLMVQHLSLADNKKQHLKLSPLEEGVSFELVHLHFQDKVVKELSVTGSEPIEIGFRLIAAEPGSSGLQIHGLNDGVWRLLHTTEQSFPVCLEAPPEALPETKPDAKSEAQTKAAKPETAEQPEAQSKSPAEQPADNQSEQRLKITDTSEPVAETVQTDAESSSISVISVQPQKKPAPFTEPVIEKTEPVNSLTWLEPIPEHYQPLLLHLQTHSSLTEAAMISLLGGGNGGARKARGFANQVDQWQLPFEIEIVSTDEGKSYRKV